MDIPDILKIIIFDDFLKIAKKGPPKDPVPVLPFGKDRIYPIHLLNLKKAKDPIGAKDISYMIYDI